MIRFFDRRICWLRRVVSSAAVLGLTVSCATSAAAQKTSVKAAAPMRDHVIAAGDVLRLRVWPEEALSGEYPVEVTGLVHLPLLGEVPVAGLSHSAVQRKVRDLYAQVMKNPVVSTTPVFQVSITGEVVAPGTFLTEPTHNVMAVIARAGGFTTRARLDRLRIIRADTAFDFDARALLRDGALSNLTLQSGDWIVVPKRGGIPWQGVVSGLQLLGTLSLIATQIRD